VRPHDPFANINTPDELVRARAIVREEDEKPSGD
jgi:hypothetical protein